MKLADEKVWKQLLEEKPKLKELAIKAGVVDNFKRVQELNGCLAVNCGDGVIQTEEERELAIYLFCSNSDYKAAIEGRRLIARSAQIKDL